MALGIAAAEADSPPIQQRPAVVDAVQALRNFVPLVVELFLLRRQIAELGMTEEKSD